MTNPARRWSNEGVILAELERLGDQALEIAAEYLALATEAAETEAAHKALRAKRVLLAKARGVKSISEAESVSEADPDVAEAYVARLVAAAKADATRETLRTIRTIQDGLRTAVASHRTPVVGPGYQ